MRGDTARHFSERELRGEAPADAAGIGRLLEDGDGEDLRRLVAACGEARLVAWLEERGGRQLSRRSRAFWARVLRSEPSAPAPTAEALWPL